MADDADREWGETRHEVKTSHRIIGAMGLAMACACAVGVLSQAESTLGVVGALACLVAFGGASLYLMFSARPLASDARGLTPADGRLLLWDDVISVTSDGFKGLVIRSADRSLALGSGLTGLRGLHARAMRSALAHATSPPLTDIAVGSVRKAQRWLVAVGLLFAVVAGGLAAGPSFVALDARTVEGFRVFAALGGFTAAMALLLLVFTALFARERVLLSAEGFTTVGRFRRKLTLWQDTIFSFVERDGPPLLAVARGNEWLLILTSTDEPASEVLRGILEASGRSIDDVVFLSDPPPGSASLVTRIVITWLVVPLVVLGALAAWLAPDFSGLPPLQQAQIEAAGNARRAFGMADRWCTTHPDDPAGHALRVDTRVRIPLSTRDHLPSLDAFFDAYRQMASNVNPVLAAIGHRALAMQAWRDGDLPRALDHLDHSLAAVDDPRVRVDRGEILLAIGEYARARDAVADATTCEAVHVRLESWSLEGDSEALRSALVDPRVAGCASAGERLRWSVQSRDGGEVVAAFLQLARQRAAWMLVASLGCIALIRRMRKGLGSVVGVGVGLGALEVALRMGLGHFAPSVSAAWAHGAAVSTCVIAAWASLTLVRDDAARRLAAPVLGAAAAIVPSIVAVANADLPSATLVLFGPYMAAALVAAPDAGVRWATDMKRPRWQGWWTGASASSFVLVVALASLGTQYVAMGGMVALAFAVLVLAGLALGALPPVPRASAREHWVVGLAILTVGALSQATPRSSGSAIGELLTGAFALVLLTRPTLLLADPADGGEALSGR